MARVLLGWELGAGRGHAVRLAGLVRQLEARGHAVVLAVQQTGSVPATGEVWQAPLWPGQIVALARRGLPPPRTMGDILAALGLGDVAATAGLIGAWDRLLAATGPDLVVAEFAPGLMLAAKGRVKLLATGNGFSLPPAAMAEFPSSGGGAALHDEDVLLGALNDALGRCGRAPLAALPAIFGADVALPATFAELDPYRPWRAGGHGAPALDGPVPLAGDGDELFVYLTPGAPRSAAYFQGLAASGLRVRIHARDLLPAEAEALRGAGLVAEAEPVPFASIAERSRLLLSHGGLGFVSSALLAGLPQAMLPFDMEKQFTANAVVGLGLGEAMPARDLPADALAAMLRRLAGDDALATRCRLAAPDFRARAARSSEEESMDAIEALLRR